MNINSNIAEEIDVIWNYHLNVRSHFPYVNKRHIGKRIIQSAPFYSFRGYSIKYDYGKDLQEQDIEHINNLSNWLNQNALIRLYSLMNYHKFIGDNISIDKSINGWKELDILRRLRNQFSHRDGKLNPSNGVQVKLVKEIIMNFRLVDQEYDHIPISIDLVIKPIFEGCKVYALEKILKNKTGS